MAGGLFWLQHQCINESFTPGGGGPGGSSSASYAETLLALSPTAYWRLGESSGNLVDSSGNSHTLTAGGTAPTYGVSGWTGDEDKAITFAGLSYFNVADHADWDMGLGDFSVTFAFKRTGAPAAEEAIVGHDLQGYDGEWGVLVSTATDIVYLILDGSAFALNCPGVNLFDGTLRHFVIGVDRDASAHLYLDGVEQTAASVAAKSAVALDNTRSLWVGARDTTQYRLTGTLDEVAIFKGVLLNQTNATALYGARNGTGSGTLSQSETYANAILALSPRAYYPMTDSGSVMTDMSTNANHGTYTGSPTRVTGPITGTTAVSFDGSTQWASANYSTALDFTAAQDYSIVLWIKFPSWPASEAWLIGRSGDGYDNDYELKTAANDVLRGRMIETEISSGSAVNLDDGNWHFIVRSVDRDGNCVHYFDNTSNGSTNVSALSIALERALPLYIARRQTLGLLAATIGQVAIIPVALSGGQVATLYTAAGY